MGFCTLFTFCFQWQSLEGKFTVRNSLRNGERYVDVNQGERRVQVRWKTSTRLSINSNLLLIS